MDEIKKGLEPMFKEARERGFWFYTSYHDLWFSPDELEQAQSEGRFMWGAVNWQLRNPYERLNELDARTRNAQQARDDFMQRIRKSES
jgi:hypothetical protein